MGWFNFGFGRVSVTNAPGVESEIPEIYKLQLPEGTFVAADVRATYVKILTDVVERTSGVPEQYAALLWDNCLASESQLGLVSLLADAMVAKSDLFLVLNRATGVLRTATPSEEAEIRKDYEQTAASLKGVYVSFKRFGVTDMLNLYARVEYCVVAGLYKSVNVSKAVQIKIANLRESVSLADAGIGIAQAQAIAAALRGGQDVMLDVEDDIATSTPDVAPIERAVSFIDAKRAWYLNLPLAYVSGLRAASLGDTGEADTRSIERGLRHYFLSIFKPVADVLFQVKTVFKSQDFRANTSANETVKTFELVSDEYISAETKRDIVARLYDVDPVEEAKRIEAEQAEAEAERAERAKLLPPAPPTVVPDPRAAPPSPQPPVAQRA